MKKGHSNAHVESTEPWPDNANKARIPIEGGAGVYTVKELPPLALEREEWAAIGRKMGWRPSLYVQVSGGLISDMATDLPVSVFVLDTDNADTGDVQTEEWSLSDSINFEKMRAAYDKSISRELIESAA